MTKLLSERYYVYILQCKDKTLYTGITNDIDRRVKQHNNGTGSKYTRGRGPVKLVRLVMYPSKSEAAKEEYRIKKLPRREKLKLCARRLI